MTRTGCSSGKAIRPTTAVAIGRQFVMAEHDVGAPPLAIRYFERLHGRAKRDDGDLETFDAGQRHLLGGRAVRKMAEDLAPRALKQS
jgi:hypothetical protein